MATNNKDAIRVGDTYAASFECLAPTSEDPNSFQFWKEAVNPTDTEVQLWSVTEQEYLLIGPGDTDTDTATVTDNIVSYLVAGEHTQVTGDYKLYITAIFSDGQRVTEEYLYKVRAKQ